MQQAGWQQELGGKADMDQIAKRGSGVGHGVGAVGDNKAVISIVILPHLSPIHI